MGLEIREVSRDNLDDVETCDGAFTVDAKLIVIAEDNAINYTIVGVTPYQKKYPPETVGYDSYVNARDQVIFLAYMNRAVAGHIRLRRNWNQFAYVEDLVVDVCHRKRGIGRALIEKAAQWAKEKHLSGVMLETQNNNVAACLFYQRCGFTLGGFDRLLYRGQDPYTDEVALFWYLTFQPQSEGTSKDA
jgi:streptothricin acetyltransferase